MTSHASAYELTASRTPAGGSARIDSTYVQVIGLLDGTATNQSPILPKPPVPYSGYVLMIPNVKYRVQVITDDVTDLMVLEGQTGDDFWSVNGVPTDNDILVDAVGVNASQSAGGRMTGDVILQFSQDVQTAIEALTGTVEGYKVTRWWQYKNLTAYSGQAHLVEFEEKPTATAQLSTRAPQLLNQLNSSGNVCTLGTLANGTKISVGNCVLAGLAPEGAVYIAPEDTGSNPDQIPASVTNNTADKFRFHPSVFIRRGAYWNSVVRKAFDGTDLVQPSVGQPIQIVTVDNPITQSRWMIGIDGTFQVVTIQHGNLDLRRPRDIWEQVWIPILNGSTSVRDALSVGAEANNTDVGKLTRIQYLEYARCLPLPGSSVPQDDTAEA